MTNTKSNETPFRSNFSIARTSCTGMCDQGPALLVNGWAIPRLTVERIDQIAALVAVQGKA